MSALVALAAGFAAGMLAVALAWRSLVEVRAARQLERWRAGRGDRRAVLQAVHAHRAGAKAQLGSELAPLLPALPYEPADIRFLGHPAQFVVFAGHTAVKDGRQAELAEVVLVSLRSEGGEGADARLLDECLRAGRVRWVTLRVETQPPGATATASRATDPPDPTAALGKGRVGKGTEGRASALRDGRRR